MAITAQGLAGFGNAVAPQAQAQGTANPVSAPPVTQPNTLNRAPPTVGTPGPFDQFRNTLNLPAGIPQAYVDEIIDQSNRSPNTGGGANLDPNALAKNIIDGWSRKPQPDQQRYVDADSKRLADANTKSAQEAAAKSSTDAVSNTANQINTQWNNTVVPALGTMGAAGQAQKVGDVNAVNQIAGNANAYTGTVNANQGARMADVNQTNALQSSLGGQSMQSATGTNAANSGLVGQMGGAAQNANATNTGLTNQLGGAVNSTNQANTGVVNQLGGAVGGANAQQVQALAQLGSDRNVANSQANSGLSLLQNDIQDTNASQGANLQNYVQQISQLNGNDRTNYINYLQETNPQMAALIAQQSNAGDVQNQTNVMNQYQALTNPQVTDQERLIGEQARQKFEAGDQSSREAVMQQLAGRGLKSGGLVIANQQQAQQQLGNDRMMAEMGLNANAVGRSMTALQGYGTAANSLRNADDAMKQFQDQYAQNDAIRQSQLAQQRAQQGLNTTSQIGTRNTSGYNAGTDTNNQNFSRNQTGYNANSDTVGNNFARNADVYSASTGTTDANFGRTSGALNTQLGVNQTNLGNTGSAIGNAQSTNQTNLGNTNNAINTGLGVNQANNQNTQEAVNTGLGVNSGNSTRTQSGLAAGDTTAGNVLTAGNLAPGATINNLGNEAQTAATGAGIASGAFGTAVGAQNQVTQQSKDAVAQSLGFKDYNAMQANLKA